eukprot:RCo028209
MQGPQSFSLPLNSGESSCTTSSQWDSCISPEKRLLAMERSTAKEAPHDTPKGGEEPEPAPKKFRQNPPLTVTTEGAASPLRKPGTPLSPTGGGCSLARFGDMRGLPLKADHHRRPLWVSHEHIFVEAFCEGFENAQPFLVAIAEPVSRTALIHEYELTPDSLFAAVSLGISSDVIVAQLNTLSKTSLPASTVEFIHQQTGTFGKVKMVLENQVYFIEGTDLEVITLLYNDEQVRRAVGRAEDGSLCRISSTELTTDAGGVEHVFRFPLMRDVPGQPRGFKVREDLRRRCRELRHPLATLYDFHADRENPTVDLRLKPSTRLRAYQETALSKVFTNGRARSGIIVLPCGAGKTLVGITASATICRRVLVVCLNTVSVEQWLSQFQMWSTARPEQLSKFTAEQKDVPSDIMVTTYSMLSFGGERSTRSQAVLAEMRGIEWGLVILDEVHVVPAKTFREVIEVVHAHCLLGLTATLLREDDKIDDLKFLLGPKLYEANWLELSREGSLATVTCVEVHCPMTKEFYDAYLNSAPSRQTQLYIFNPYKFWCTQALIEYHEKRGDKVIVFSDSVAALRHYATVLKRPFIEGEVVQSERMSVLDHFKHHPKINTIFITKVGDTSIDLPEATVIVQISSHFGSRRQEAQRLGRILRPKGAPTPAAESGGAVPPAGNTALFYSLVSSDTRELYYNTKRQRFLLDQGYSYKVIQASVVLDCFRKLTHNPQPFKLFSAADQAKLLQHVLSLKEQQMEREERAAAEAAPARKAFKPSHPILKKLYRKTLGR